MVSQFGSLGYTITGKTADLTVVQKTIIDTLHKEGKPHTSITKEAGCSQSAISKHVNRKLSGRKKCWRKRCTTNRENRKPYEDCQEKSIQEFGWTSQGMDWGWGQGIKSHTHRRVKEFRLQLSSEASYWARRRTGTVAQWVQSPLFRWEQVLVFHLETKVLESGGRVEKLIAQVAWSPVLSFHSLWWFGVQCHLLVLVHCVFWKPTSLHPFTNTFWSTSCFLQLTIFLKMLISFSSRIWYLPTLPKAPKVG